MSSVGPSEIEASGIKVSENDGLKDIGSQGRETRRRHPLRSEGKEDLSRIDGFVPRRVTPYESAITCFDRKLLSRMMTSLVAMRRPAIRQASY
jgi:hypothetical protein